MENATKALLIAGSVLIAILLIALGLRIFNSTTDTTKNSQAAMDTTSIMTFNGQFTGFLGKEISAAQASTLAQKIIASNAVNKNHSVKYAGSNSIPTSLEKGPYKCETDENGYICNIYKNS